MTDKSKKILERMNSIIETSTLIHKAAAERYLSLANRQLHKDEDRYGIMDASYALKSKWEDKFGPFIPRSTHT